MSKTFTIEEFKNFLLKQDSYGDIFYNLSEANILAAQEQPDVEVDILSSVRYKKPIVT